MDKPEHTYTLCLLALIFIIAGYFGINYFM